LSQLKKQKVSVIIPARYASTRFEGKPLAKINGQPMIYHVYKRVEESSFADESIVATDDRRIFDVVSDFGGKVVMTSPEHPTGTDRVAEVADKLDSDIIVNVQGDEPLIVPEMIDQVVQPLLDESAVEVTNTITQIISPADYLDPTVVKAVKDKKDNLLFLTRSPIPFPKTRQRFAIYKQVGLYAFRRAFLHFFAQMEQTDLELREGIEFLRLLENGYRVRAVISNHNPISVDTISDLKEVEKVMVKDKSVLTFGEKNT